MDVRISLAALVAALAVAGCGLTLDYDPPTDAGVDARLDGGSACGVCPSGRTCFDGACRLRCTGTECHDDPTACESCVGGLCLPADVTCPGGSACATATCDGADDVCRTTTLCAEGMSCVMGACVEGTCSNDTDCALLLDDCGESLVCPIGGGTCEARERPACLPLAGSCAVVDPCTCSATDEIDPDLCGDDTVCDESTGNCVECLETGDCRDDEVCHPDRHECVECAANADCPVGLVCDPASFACVQCFDLTHCPDSGPTICDPTTRTCVECLGDGDCIASGSGGRFCDPTGTCIDCRTGDDCDRRIAPICGADGSCRPCSAGDDCGPSSHCDAGACVPDECAGDSECPNIGCATGRCDTGMGVCTFDLDDSYCADGAPGGDGVSCTVGVCAPSAGTADGCVHRPDDTLCPDDGYSCTTERCGLTSSSGVDRGCVHLRNDAMCNTAAGGFECAIGVCAGGEPHAVVDPVTGCGLSYEPNRCGLFGGTICTARGSCETGPSCSLGMPCPDDGVVCNGGLRCVLGACRQSPDLGLDACLGTPICQTYCSTTGCAVRTDPPAGLMCTAVATRPGTGSP